MTKYILHGGATSALDVENKIFFNAIAKDFKSDSTILLIYFSRKKEDYEQSFEQDKMMFLDNSDNKKVNFIVASEENFIEELKKADAVYMRGGDTLQLLNTLKKYTEFTDLIQTKKVVAGSSAGAYVLVKFFFSNSKNDIYEGLGILPIKMICHYKEEKHKNIVEKLEETGEDLEIVKLRDFESRILYA